MTGDFPSNVNPALLLKSYCFFLRLFLSLSFPFQCFYLLLYAHQIECTCIDKWESLASSCLIDTTTLQMTTEWCKVFRLKELERERRGAGGGSREKRKKKEQRNDTELTYNDERAWSLIILPRVSRLHFTALTVDNCATIMLTASPLFLAPNEKRGGGGRWARTHIRTYTYALGYILSLSTRVRGQVMKFDWKLTTVVYTRATPVSRQFARTRTRMFAYKICIMRVAGQSHHWTK